MAVAVVSNRLETRGTVATIHAILATIDVNKPLAWFNRFIPMPSSIRQQPVAVRRAWMIEHWGAASVFGFAAHTETESKDMQKLTIDFRSVPNEPFAVVRALSEHFPTQIFRLSTADHLTGSRSFDVIDNGRVVETKSWLGTGTLPPAFFFNKQH